MSVPHVAVAAVIHPDKSNYEQLLADVAGDLAGAGAVVRGLIQRDTPDEDGGHRHMDLIDVETGQAFRISQDLGHGSTSCCFDPAGAANAAQVLRRAVDSRPDLVLINRFGSVEINGGGFLDELQALLANGIPVLTMVAERHKADWLRFTGRSGTLLPPSLDAVRRWFDGNAAFARPAGRNTVLADTVAALKHLLGDGILDLTVERAVVGRFFTGVKLGNGRAGACYTPAKPVITSENCCRLPAEIRDAGRFKGRRVGDVLAGMEEGTGVGRALGVAAVNALAEGCWRERPHPGWRVETGVDALTAVAVQPGERVVMVGAFVSYIRRLRDAGHPFTVLELDPVALLADEMPFYRPAAQAGQVVPSADVLLMTGATVANDTIDDILGSAAPEARVAVIGPSVPMLPDVLADRGADLLGTIRITDPDHFLDVLAEGGGTQGLYDGSAELVVLRRCD